MDGKKKIDMHLTKGRRHYILGQVLRYCGAGEQKLHVKNRKGDKSISGNERHFLHFELELKSPETI